MTTESSGSFLQVKDVKRKNINDLRVLHTWSSSPSLDRSLPNKHRKVHRRKKTIKTILLQAYKEVVVSHTLQFQLEVTLERYSDILWPPQLNGLILASLRPWDEAFCCWSMCCQLSCWKNIIYSQRLSRNSGAELHFTSLLSLFSIWGALWRAHFHQATTKVFASSILSKQNETERTPKGAGTCCVTSLKSQSKPSAQLLAGGSSRLHDSEQAVSEVPRFFWVSSLQSETYWTYHLDLRQNRKLESTESSSQALTCAQFNLPSLPASKLITATVPEW